MRRDRAAVRRWGRLRPTPTRPLLARQRAADVALDRVQLATLLGGGEARRVAVGFGASGAADAVDVVLGGLRQVVVDDAADVGDVDAAGRDVGRDQDAIAPAPEAFERLAALLLRPVRVQPLGGVSGGAERAA